MWKFIQSKLGYLLFGTLADTISVIESRKMTLVSQISLRLLVDN